MAKTERDGTFWQTMTSAGLYKRNQGRLTRGLTAAAIAATVLIGAWTLSATSLTEGVWTLVAPVILAIAGCWFAFRIVNYPAFADFLVDVEAEMVKVSWPDRAEVWRATIVVLFTMFLFSFVLFGYEIVIQQSLRWIGVLRL